MLLSSSVLSVERTAPVTPGSAAEERLAATALVGETAVGVNLFSGVVARFSAPGLASDVLHYRALVDWGDGAGPVDATFQYVPPATFAISGTKLFIGSGMAHVTAMLADDRLPEGANVVTWIQQDWLTQSNGTLRLTDLATDGARQVAGKIGEVQIPAEAASNWNEAVALQVNWGDGATSAANLVENDQGGYDILGAHAYAAEGTYNLTPTGAGVVGVQGAQSPSPSNGIAPGSVTWSGVVATIESLPQANSASKAADYKATIDWGDQTTSTGELKAQQDGSYAVVGTHVYGQLGDYAIRADVERAGGASNVCSISLPALFDATAELYKYVVSSFHSAGFASSAPASSVQGAATQPAADAHSANSEAATQPPGNQPGGAGATSPAITQWLRADDPAVMAGEFTAGASGEKPSSSEGTRAAEGKPPAAAPPSGPRVEPPADSPLPVEEDYQSKTSPAESQEKPAAARLARSSPEEPAAVDRPAGPLTEEAMAAGIVAARLETLLKQIRPWAQHAVRPEGLTAAQPAAASLTPAMPMLLAIPETDTRQRVPASTTTMLISMTLSLPLVAGAYWSRRARKARCIWEPAQEESDRRAHP